MNTRKHSIKRSVVTLSCLLFSVGAMAQAHSSGGGSATGYKSTLGNQNTASGNYSLAAGWGSQTTGQTSFALGYYSRADGLNSMALGMYAHSQNAYGITIGRGLSSTMPLSNTTNGIMLGMYSNVPTLYISPSSGENRTGKVSIGNVTAPSAKLHIAGDVIENADILLASTGTNKSVIQFRSSSNSIAVGSDNIMNFSATSYSFTTGKVGIGCVNNMNDFALAVQGGIVSSKVSVIDTDSWPDFVFRDNYKLMSLYELESYINTNRHLPEVPSAEEVSACGIDLGGMNAILLQKVEELTLHVIELQKQIDELKAR